MSRGNKKKTGMKEECHGMVRVSRVSLSLSTLEEILQPLLFPSGFRAVIIGLFEEYVLLC